MIPVGKHAYLIICHNNFTILKMLVKMLDHPRNDIYIHVDRKVKSFDQWKNELRTEHAKLKFTKRIFVNWGGFSQIQAELILLEAATKQKYDYYHLLSGVDMPLKPQSYIHDYFDAHQGVEFIGIDDCSVDGTTYAGRVRFFHFLQNRIGRNSGIHIAILERLENSLLHFQQLLNIDRIKRWNTPIYKGPNWFSITHKMAGYVLTQEDQIKKRFGFGLCVDELFLQTLAMESPYAENVKNDSLRYIDWNRGSPYTFRTEDFDILMNSGKLFARKFDSNTDMQIVEQIFNSVSAGSVNGGEDESFS